MSDTDEGWTGHHHDAVPVGGYDAALYALSCDADCANCTGSAPSVPAVPVQSPEPPAPSADSHIDTIRFRLQTGYYNNPKVDDALSDKLSGYFDDVA